MQKQKTEKEDFRLGDILQQTNKQTIVNRCSCVAVCNWIFEQSYPCHVCAIVLIVFDITDRSNIWEENYYYYYYYWYPVVPVFSPSLHPHLHRFCSLSTVYIRNQWFCTCLIVAAFVNPPSYPSTVLVCRPACPVSHRADYNIAIRTTPFLEFHNTTLSSPPLCAVRVVTLLRAHTQQAMILGRRRRWIVCKKRERWQ